MAPREKNRHHHKLSFGMRAADAIASTLGSWPFVIIQTVILIAWVILNVMAIVKQWDPYPFILLNLFLSLQAAYTGPLVMMSQNRQAEIDRMHMEEDYNVNKQALELIQNLFTVIEALHTRIDSMEAKK